jgi:hypothetical protein
MTTGADYDKLFDAIDAETTRIGTEFGEILAALAAGGMSAEEEAAKLARGNALVEKLKAISKNDPTGGGETGGGTGEGEGSGSGGGEGEPAAPASGEAERG